MLLPHDDLIAPRYLATLVDHAEAQPRAACVYCDIAVQGQAPIVQPSVCGPPLARQLTLLAGHMAAVAFRGLVRRTALAAVGGLCENAADDFAADTVWLARLARAGELHRVAGALYEKRYHAASTHAAWLAWEAGRQRRAWIVHCREMLAEALLCAPDAVTRRTLLAAAVARVVASFPQDYPFPWLLELDQEAKLVLAEEFLTAVGTDTDLGLDTGLSPRTAAWHLVASQFPAETALACLAGEVARRDQTIERLSQAVARLEAERVERAGEQARLVALLAEMSQATAGLTNELARLTERLLDLENDCHRLADENAQLRASTSWRITAPMRAVRERLGQRRARVPE
jgi:hypothetical protein